jgi:hypothetical protein
VGRCVGVCVVQVAVREVVCGAGGGGGRKGGRVRSWCWVVDVMARTELVVGMVVREVVCGAGGGGGGCVCAGVCVVCVLGTRTTAFDPNTIALDPNTIALDPKDTYKMIQWLLNQQYHSF